jgi:hypothetical protein
MPRRLVELDPRWLTYDGQRYGLTFRCPCCLEKTWMGKRMWLTCFAVSGVKIFGNDWIATGPQDELGATPGKWIGLGQFAMFTEALSDLGLGADDMVPSDKNCAWTFTPPIEQATFEILSLSPSIDASKSGHWHGHILGGMVSP